MALSFRQPGLFGRINTPAVRETLTSLIHHLEKNDIQLCVEAETAKSLPGKIPHPVIPREALGKQCDLLVVVGGDGSLLHAAKTAVEQNLPVLGVNRGSLGFLTDIRPTAAAAQIDAILAGHYTIEERFLLTATTCLEGQRWQDDALNEVALMPNSFPHMTEFEIYIDDMFVCSQHADGLIAATPTGSTAYALSGGGPILHPDLDAVVLVPMFPHSLGSRPIVISGNATVTLRLSGSTRLSPRLSCDGHTCILLSLNEPISICKKNQMLRLVHPLSYDYYETLRSKLHWGKKLTGGAS